MQRDSSTDRNDSTDVDDNPMARPGSRASAPDSSSAVHLGPGVRLDPELVRELATAASVFGCELLHIGRSGSALQLVIDHSDGVTVDQCADVSRQASAILDRDDYGSSAYVLEVSSPGIERELYRAADYERFAGERIRITFVSNGAKRTVEGELVGIGSNREIEIRPEAGFSKDDEVLAVPIDDVQRARLIVEI